MYKTIKNSSFAEFTEKKSRFLTYASHVSSTDEASLFLKNIRDKHWDASHNVYAYLLRNNQIKKFSDDGEPHGSAGIHILNVITRSQLMDIIVVVTRYFGGTLLGTGGLVRAYTSATQLALKNAIIIPIYLCQIFSLSFDYSLYSLILRIISQYQHKILDTTYNNAVSIKVAVNHIFYDKISAELLDISNGNLKIINLNLAEMDLS